MTDQSQDHRIYEEHRIHDEGQQQSGSQRQRPARPARPSGSARLAAPHRAPSGSAPAGAPSVTLQGSAVPPGPSTGPLPAGTFSGRADMPDRQLRSAMEEPEQVPFVPARLGERVLYVLSEGHRIGTVRAADVVNPRDGTHPNLVVLTDAQDDFPPQHPGYSGHMHRISVAYSENPTPGTWHRPARPVR